MTRMTDMRIAPAGDAALLVELPQAIEPAISARAIALAAALRSRWGSVLRDVVVGYCSVTVYFDPLNVDAAWLEAAVVELGRQAAKAAPDAGDLVDVPVCYGGDLGPDLADVALHAGCSEDAVADLHCSTTYRVYMTGFVPGFPYMARVDPRLTLPRRAVPRTRVPAGSVALAAGQTGIYPMETPGGWHLIGRTPLKPYDPRRARPFLFKPGDRVRFHRMTRKQFDAGS